MKTDEFYAVPIARKLDDSQQEIHVSAHEISSRLSIAILMIVVFVVCGFLWREIAAARTDLLNPDMLLSSTELVPQESQRNPIFDLNISPLGDVLLYRNLQGEIIRQDLVNDSSETSEHSLFPTEYCELLKISPIRDQLAVATRSGAVLVRDLHQAKSTICLLKPNQHMIECLEFSPDGRLLAVGLSEGKVFVYDLEQEHLVSVIRSKGQTVSSLVFDSPMSLLVSLEGRLEHWSFRVPQRTKTSLGRPLRLHRVKDWELSHSPVREMKLSSDSKYLICTTFHRSLTCVTLDSQEILWERATELPCARSLQFSRDESYFVAHAEQDVISLHSVATGEPVGWLSDSGMGTGTGAGFSIDGNLLYTTSTDGYIRIWSMSGQTLIGMIETQYL